MAMQIGNHLVTLEEDVLQLKLRGAFLPDELRAVLQLAEQLIATKGHYFGLVDITDLDPVPAETRRIGVEWARVHRIGGNACFGGSAATRILIALAMNSISLLTGSAVAVAFFETEQEASSWIAEQRGKLAA